MYIENILCKYRKVKFEENKAIKLEIKRKANQIEWN